MKAGRPDKDALSQRQFYVASRPWLSLVGAIMPTGLKLAVQACGKVVIEPTVNLSHMSAATKSRLVRQSS